MKWYMYILHDNDDNDNFAKYVAILLIYDIRSALWGNRNVQRSEVNGGSSFIHSQFLQLSNFDSTSALFPFHIRCSCLCFLSTVLLYVSLCNCERAS